MAPDTWRTVSVTPRGVQREVKQSGLFEGVRLFRLSAVDAEGAVLKTTYYSALDNSAMPTQAEALKRALDKKNEIPK